MRDSTFVHDRAIVEAGATIGRGTRVWAFAHILAGAVIGVECNICDGVFIENDVLVGDRVTIKPGVQLWDGVRLENDVFVGPNATFTNDPFPRSKQRPTEYSRTLVREGASIGANATILPGVVVGRGSMIGAGAVVTGDVPPYAIATGNPARIQGYASSVEAHATLEQHTSRKPEAVEETSVAGVRVYRLPLVEDMRGTLSAGEYDRQLPFITKRYFIVFDVSTKEVRGEHAHKALHQFLVCVTGACAVVVDDGRSRCEIVLDRPNIGVHIPPLIWATQYKFSPDAVLLALASEVYDADDYIRDYDKFLAAVHQE